jgi:hypothetical protein
MKRRSFLATLGLSALFGREVPKAATQPVARKRRLSATEVSSMASEREDAILHKHCLGRPIHLRDLEPISKENDETIRALYHKHYGQFEGVTPNIMGSFPA